MTADRQMSVLDVPQEAAATRLDAPRHPFADMRHALMMLPVEEQQAKLAEYTARRTSYRDWLKSIMVEGIHYGFPPGCEPVYDDRGWIGVKSRGDYTYYPPEQWQAKPSLYAAGADLVCDVAYLEDKYEADMAGWEQLGKQAGTLVYKCILYPRGGGASVAEGRGSAKSGAKNRDDNGALKVAMKSAKICAVLNCYGLRDLFSQDAKPLEPPRHDNPDHDANAPKSQPRGERVSLDTIKALGSRWLAVCKKRGELTGEGEWLAFVRGVCGMGADYNFLLPSNWTGTHVSRVEAALMKMEATA